MKKWVKPIVAAVAASFTAGWAYTLYMGSVITAAGGAMALSGAQFAAASFTGSAISGAVAGATFGFTNTLLHGGSIGNALGAGAIGGLTGAMFGGVAGRYGNTWNFSRVSANGVLGGVSSKVNGGKFAEGFKFMFMTSSARLAYNATLKYDVTWKGATGRVDADGAYDEGSFGEPIRIPELGNTYGTNDELRGRLWADFFKQGGALSVVSNRIPGLQSVSKLHDYYQLGFDRISGYSDSTLRTAGNVPAMVPAGLISYGALLNDPVYLAADIHRRN